MNDEIFKIIYDSVAILNEEIQRRELNNPGPETVLYGEKGVLDSLALVNLIVCVEQTILDVTGKSVVLADERAVSQSRSPFKTVKSLAEHIESLI